jgi:hypothetical protein
MAYTKFTNVEAKNIKGNVTGNVTGNVMLTKDTIALTADKSSTKNYIVLSSVTASKVLTVNVPSGALFVVSNGDSTNAVTIKCSATDVGASLAKSTTGIYVNVAGVATLIK